VPTHALILYHFLEKSSLSGEYSQYINIFIIRKRWQGAKIDLLRGE
jgi:hypothetical protein